ncbi:restriction endonuclease subunit S [bacterium]|nr:restriction endonuclease subunit S [bacterium]
MREMKDSGIEWVGAIPATWKIHPLYYYFSERKCKNTLGKENNLLSLSYGRVIRKDINTVDGLLPENYNGYNIIEKDDIVLRLTDLQNDKRSLRTGLVREHGIITSAYTTIKANRELVPEFFQYLLHSYDVMKVLYNMGSGVRQGLNFSELSKMPLISPDMLEQKKIADFLDTKCSEIDAISADIQKEIETLEQYKRSVITEAVTKGLNPDVEMKDSGIEWVGNIPAHWDTIPIRYLFAECRLKNILNQEKTALKFTYGTIIKKTNFDSDSDEYVANTMTNYTVVYPGTIMINGLNLNYDFVSQRVGLVKDRGAITSAYLAIVPGSRVVSEYANYQLKSWDYAKAFHNMGTGVRKTLDFSELGKKYFVTPSIEEQSKIVAFLDSKCKEIEAIIASKKQQLTVIDSYKKSLIYEYVTGKKEVPAQN